MASHRYFNVNWRLLRKEEVMTDSAIIYASLKWQADQIKRLVPLNDFLQWIAFKKDLPETLLEVQIWISSYNIGYARNKTSRLLQPHIMTPKSRPFSIQSTFSAIAK